MTGSPTFKTHQLVLQLIRCSMNMSQVLSHQTITKLSRNYIFRSRSQTDIPKGFITVWSYVLRTKNQRKSWQNSDKYMEQRMHFQASEILKDFGLSVRMGLYVCEFSWICWKRFDKKKDSSRFMGDSQYQNVPKALPHHLQQVMLMDLLKSFWLSIISISAIELTTKMPVRFLV